MSEIKSFYKALDKRASFTQIIGWATMLTDKILMLKDGAFQAVFRYYGDDVQSMTDDLSFSLAERFSEGVTKFWHDNVVIETDLVRKKAAKYTKAQSFGDVVSAVIDQERAWQFNSDDHIYESVHTISITYREREHVSSKLERFIYDCDDEIKEKSIDDQIMDFESRLREFMAFVSFGDSKKYKRLADDDLLSFIDTCITGKNRKIGTISPGRILDAYLAKADFIAGFEPIIGESHIKILSFDGFPNQVRSMILHVLNTLQIEFRYHLRFVKLDKRQADKRLKGVRRSWSSKAIGVTGVVKQSLGLEAKLNEAAEMRKIESDEAIVENEDGVLSYGFLTGVFVLHDEDRSELIFKAQHLKSAIEHYGFAMRDERINATDAYLGSFPGHGDNNQRFYLMDSLSWSMMMPLSSVYAGEECCPNPMYPEPKSVLSYAKTDHCNVYRFNNFVDDVGHTLIIGPTGAGKTTLLEHLLSQHRKYENAQQIFLGKDRCAKIAILAHGGAYFDFADDKFSQQLNLAPLIDLDSTYNFELAKDWLVSCFEINKVKITAEEMGEINEAMQRLKTLPAHERILSNLSFQHKTLRQGWHTINQGLFAEVLGGDSNNLDFDCIGFDIGEVLSIKQESAVPILLAILSILTRKFSTCQPTLLFLDEAWLMLDNDVFIAKLKDWLKTLRKFNVSVIFSSQSLSDVFDSTISSVLMESCMTKIFLPNDQALSEEINHKYKKLGLNQAEIALISKASPKREYYVVQPKGRRLIDFDIGAIALSLLGVNPKNKLFYEHFDPENPVWLVDYLAACDLKEDAEFVQEFFAETKHA